MELVESESDQLKTFVRENLKMGRIRKEFPEILKENSQEYLGLFKTFNVNDEEFLDQAVELILKLKEHFRKIEPILNNLEEKKVQALKILKKAKKNQIDKSLFLVKNIELKNIELYQMTLNGVEVVLMQPTEFSIVQGSIFKLFFQDLYTNLQQIVEFELKEYLMQNMDELAQECFDLRIQLSGFDYHVKVVIQINLTINEKISFLNERIREIDSKIFDAHQQAQNFYEILDAFSLKLDKEKGSIYSTFKDPSFKRNSCCEDCLVF